MLTDREILLLCALLIFAAARGEEVLCASDRIKGALGVLGALALAACLAAEGDPITCDECHRDCGVLRSGCHEHCDEQHCLGGDQVGVGGAGGAGEDGFE
ncbi:hypothetical protein [Sorangium sp. So ce233]|uniref:hypothetical protein n=1 Tax=Sorangium sp. So ce233 TaxID=3133290 RepID=UPI003F611396